MFVQHVQSGFAGGLRFRIELLTTAAKIDPGPSNEPSIVEIVVTGHARDQIIDHVCGVYGRVH